MAGTTSKARPGPTTPKVPTNLRVAGRKIWTDTVAVFDLRSDELAVLEAACREADLVKRLDDELRSAPLMVRGSMGQDVPNGLLTEIRLHRATLASLLRSLNLPADADAGSTSRDLASSGARAMAEKRWRRGA